MGTGDMVKRTSELLIENKPHIEKWTSSEGRTEIHYFTEDDEYLFGYNPLIMPDDVLNNLKKWIEDV